jgi:hypothetical protein
MIADLRTSPILSWPIFTKKLAVIVAGDGLSAAKYERFLFRLYQVHLWNDLFSGAARSTPSALAAK